MKLHLTTVTLGVADLALSRAFYEQGMGLVPSSASSEHISFYQCGLTVLALYPRQELADDACLPAERVGRAGLFDNVTLACNCPTREAVDQLMDRARAAGARIAKPAQEAFWGGYSGYFEDPDGHLWEAVNVPFFEHGPGGNLILPD
ncbi:MAG: VOC family protein [Proteobacteria bacterium]|nr:VOC family protein [Pseudomonadota bacterium]MBU1596655.1 VOC family protein [Pseudomonadota bacterium]